MRESALQQRVVKPEPVTPANHNEQKLPNEPIRTQKLVGQRHNWL